MPVGSTSLIRGIFVLDYKFIGWCREDNHDKIWGVIYLGKQQTIGENKYLTFWGRRGSTLRSKLIECHWWDINKLIDNKGKKGYEQITPEFLIDTVYPEFNEDLEKLSIWALLRQ